MASCDVRNLTRRTTPRLPFAKVGAVVLPGWDISLVFVGSARARTLNTTLRGKQYVSNVLSYVSGTRSGEVIICLERVEKEHVGYNLSSSAYCLYLFIHGLLHLKGYPHGPTMERMERALMARFVPASKKHTHETTHRHRHRHRHTPDESRGGGRSARRGERKS